MAAPERDNAPKRPEAARPARRRRGPVVVRGAVNGVVWAIFIVVLSFYVVKDGPCLGRSAAMNVPEPWRPELGRLWHESRDPEFLRARPIRRGFHHGHHRDGDHGRSGVRKRGRPRPDIGRHGVRPRHRAGDRGGARYSDCGLSGSSWLPIPNLWFALVVGLTYFLLQQFETLYLVPRVVGSRVRLHPAAVIVGVVAGLQLGGILGVLLAAPTIASARALLNFAYRKLFDAEPFRLIEAPRENVLSFGGSWRRSMACVRGPFRP